MHFNSFEVDINLCYVCFDHRTVLYELVACRFPFRGYGAETLIYSVVKGRRQSLRELRCNNQLKVGTVTVKRYMVVGRTS